MKKEFATAGEIRTQDLSIMSRASHSVNKNMVTKTAEITSLKEPGVAFSLNLFIASTPERPNAISPVVVFANRRDATNRGPTTTRSKRD